MATITLSKKGDSGTSTMTRVTKKKKFDPKLNEDINKRVEENKKKGKHTESISPIELKQPNKILSTVKDMFTGGETMKQLRDEGRLHAGSVPIAPTGAALGLLKGLGNAAGIGGVSEATTASAIASANAQQVTAAGSTAVSKATIPGKFLGEAFSDASRMPQAGRYATNTKSLSKTTSLLGKTGFSIAAAGALVGAIGTYPFAGFIKEEALQQLGFGVNAATQAGDFETAQQLIDETNEILNPAAWEKLIGGIPYANVVKQLKDYYKAASLKNAQAQEALDIRMQEMSGERLTQFAQEQEINDEEKRQRELEDMAFKGEYYKLIREGKFDEAEELLAQQ